MIVDIGATSPLVLHNVCKLIYRNKVLRKRYLIREDNIIYTFLIKLSFSSIGQVNSKLQNQVIKLLILTETAPLLIIIVEPVYIAHQRKMTNGHHTHVAFV